MGLSALLLMTLVGGGYYASRVLPRVLARAERGAAGAQAMNQYGGGGRTAAGQAAALYKPFEYPFQSPMTAVEAGMLLGLNEQESLSPSQKQVQEQYRKMMMEFHSDVNGGSPFLSAKINEARDILVNKGGK